MYLQGNTSYRYDGTIFDRYESIEDFFAKIGLSDVMYFVDSLSSKETFLIGYIAAKYDFCKVLCNKKGVPLMIRVKTGNSSRWIISLSSWNLKPEIESIEILIDSFDHIGLGSAPTPSSLGRRSMRDIYRLYSLRSHTSLPISCENMIKQRGYGGIVVSNRIGEVIDIVSKNDKSSAYLSEYWRNPEGTPEYFSYLESHSDYPTWFAKCVVKMNKDSALGYFPYRKKHQVSYPTRKGTYHTYLWRETAEICLANGCEVKILEGWGWPYFTEDNSKWTKWIYGKRLTSPSKEVEKVIKQIAVSAIGSMNRSRKGFCLVDSSRKSGEDFPVMVENEPVDLWVHSDYDGTSALMPHWNNFTINQTNNNVREFALPYAERGELLLIDYDAVFTIGEGAGEYKVKRHSIESLNCKPGTWLWELHHNFQLLRNRMWISDEEPGRYGSLLERLKK